MSEPTNNLTTKFAALATTLGGKLDAIQTVLDALSTKADTLAFRLESIQNNTGRLESIQNNTERLESIQNNTGFLEPIYNNTGRLESIQNNTAQNNTAQIVTAITGLKGDGSYTMTDVAVRLDAVWDEACKILLAIGAFEFDPSYYTIKQLLALLQTATDSPSPGESTGNDAPPYAGTWIRQTSWKAYMPRSYGGTLYNVYSPVFSPISSPDYTLFRKDSSDNKRFLYLCDYGGTNTMSVAWNTTGHVSPVFAASLTKTLVIGGSDHLDNSFDDFSFILDCSVYPSEGSIQATGSMDVATFAVNAQACGDGDTVCEWFVLYPDGVVPTYLDFFWKAS